MKEISLTQNKVTVVDDHWYEYLMQWKWHALKSFNTFYAVRNADYDSKEHKAGKNRGCVQMHRIIKSEKGKITDHKDRNGLHNWEDNLRICTRFQNNCNSVAKGSTSKYKGVYFNKRVNRWASCVGANGRRIFVGYFRFEEAAALAYNTKALEYHGEFANLNRVYINPFIIAAFLK